MFRARERFLVCVAGRRFGKTIFALTWLASEIARRPPGALGYYVAPYRVMAKAIAWDKLLQLTKGWRIAISTSDLTVQLPGDRRISLKGADDPETLEGVGLSAVVLDEFARMKLDAWQKSVRPALSDHGGRALFCGKPRGHNHLKDFYERGQQRSAWPDWRSWLWTTLDGGQVPTADVEEARAALPAQVYRQEYEATFETLAGRVYDGFTRRTHVVPHEELERTYKRDGRWQFRRMLVAVDWGYRDPGVALVLGITSGGRIVVLHEEYRTNVLVSDEGWLGIFRELVSEYRPNAFVADPSEPGFLEATRKALRGAPVVYEADNRRSEGLRRVSVALLEMMDRRPGLLVSDRCRHTTREFEQYVYRDVRGVATEEPQDGDDHAMDALRYGVMTLTRA
jgi:hypothetical protein